MKKLQLVLTNPCAERWEAMPATDTGRYCESCTKNIVDLTTKSDAELIEFFKRKKDNVCGRLLSSQLHRELILPPSKLNWQWLLPLAVGAVLISPAQAKELKPEVVQLDQKSNFNPRSVTPTINDTISGTVVDQRTGEPLKGVKVKRKGFQNVLAITDSTGKFELSATEAKIRAEFNFELAGYSTLSAYPSAGMIIKLPVEVRITLGGVSTLSIHKEPLIIVSAGKQSCTMDGSRLKEISPEWIENLTVLKDEKSTALYGAKAENGVILIEIKKAYRKKIDFTKKR